MSTEGSRFAMKSPSGRLRSGLRKAIEKSFMRRHMFWRIPTSLPLVSVTFDDGPHPEFTPRILDILHEADAHATFFAVGQYARQSPEIIKRIVREGHTLGCHT